jgi:hypothetical protein
MACCYQHDQRQAKGFDYIQLNGSLVAKRAVDIAPAALVVTVPGYSADGAFAVQWTAVAGAQRYEVQESGGGDWQAVYQGPALNVSLAGRSSGVYRYRGRACNGTVCGAWGVEASIRVELAHRCAGDHCTGARYQRNLFPELVSGTGCRPLCA